MAWLCKTHHHHSHRLQHRYLGWISNGRANLLHFCHWFSMPCCNFCTSFDHMIQPGWFSSAHYLSWDADPTASGLYCCGIFWGLIRLALLWLTSACFMHVFGKVGRFSSNASSRTWDFKNADGYSLNRLSSNPQIMSSSKRFAKAALRIFCSTCSTLPSNSAQLSPVRKISTAYQRWMTAALRCLKAAILAFCAAWSASTFAIRGCKSMSCAESSAGGMGTSRIEVNRELVEGYELADARTIDRMFWVSKVVGISSERMDWKRSGYLESANH